jgi:hypothetical protein
LILVPLGGSTWPSKVLLRLPLLDDNDASSAEVGEVAHLFNNDMSLSCFPSGRQSANKVTISLASEHLSVSDFALYILWAAMLFWILISLSGIVTVALSYLSPSMAAGKFLAGLHHSGGPLEDFSCARIKISTSLSHVSRLELGGNTGSDHSSTNVLKKFSKRGFEMFKASAVAFCFSDEGGVHVCGLTIFVVQ